MSSYANLRKLTDVLYGDWLQTLPPPGIELATVFRYLKPKLRRAPELFADPAEFSSAQIDYHAMARWASMQHPTFSLSHGLAAKLLLTDCTNALPEDFKLPFDTFVIQLPGPDHYLSFLCGGTRRPVAGDTLLVHRFRTSPIADGGRLTLEDVLNNYDTFVRTSTRDGFCLALISEESPTKLTYTAIFPETPDDVRHIVGTNQMNENLVAHGMTVGELDTITNRAVVRLFLNLCIYLQGLSIDGAFSPNAPDNVKQLKRTPSAARRWELGRGIKLEPRLRQLARVTDALETTWRLRARFLVRGHWRDQAYGPKHSLRRRQWIQPYIKGADGDLLERSYSVT